MPELPEVETIRRGVAPHVASRSIEHVTVRDRRLRFGIPDDLEQRLEGQPITALWRRAKYLVFETPDGALLLHLGMSGRLHVLPAEDIPPPGAHAHLDLRLDDGTVLRLTDPRRFGMALWATRPVEQHKLLRSLGPEPTEADWPADALIQACQGRSAPIKSVLMDQRVVVGVGNIYANEALFQAGIHPKRAAGRISPARLRRLHAAAIEVLDAAIAQGGTTLRDFSGADGSPGYFQLVVSVYQRDGQPCRRCQTPIRRMVIGQRATFWCPSCQR